MILLGPAFETYTPETFWDYVKSLYDADFRKSKSARKGPPKILSASYTKTGALRIVVKRDPKAITHKELDELAKQVGIRVNDMFRHVKKRGITVTAKILDEKTIDEMIPW